MDPILIAVASALVGKAAGSLYELVAGRLRSTRFAGELEQVTAGDDSPQALDALAGALDEVGEADPDFFADLRHMAQELRLTVSAGSTMNEISGDVSGTVVQARDIQGGISF